MTVTYGGSDVTKKLSEITDPKEIVWMIEGYAQSARRSMDAGKDPAPTLRRIASQINRYLELTR
jgi:hypothetical protein